jgi:hypothetical protein
MGWQSGDVRLLHGRLGASTMHYDYHFKDAIILSHKQIQHLNTLFKLPKEIEKPGTPSLDLVVTKGEWHDIAASPGLPFKLKFGPELKPNMPKVTVSRVFC